MDKRVNHRNQTGLKRLAQGTIALWLALLVFPVRGADESAFSFLVLGDLHFDRAEHHDLAWLRREHPADVQQSENYSRITREVTPKLFAELGEVCAETKPPVAFVAQLGDLVEGLCGTPELAGRQCEDVKSFIGDAKLGRPFLTVKGNHDITGPGAADAYRQVILPFVAAQSGSPMQQASYTIERGDCLFVFFDGYARDGLSWLEATLNKTSARRCFVLLHQPVVPFNARSLWHIYSAPQQLAQRERLLNLLGRHRAIVLSAHLHWYGCVARKTDGGRFVQLALGSVLPAPELTAQKSVEGLKHYGPELLELEPTFESQSREKRAAALSAEAPFVDHFECAEAPGYALITVVAGRVEASIYTGLGHHLWKNIDLTALLQN